MILVKCAVCEGSGLVLARDPYVMPVDPGTRTWGGSVPGSWGMTECLLCEGTGILQATDAP